MIMICSHLTGFSAYKLSAMCRANLGGKGALLESKQLNVQVPTISDLADSLPPTWKQSICTRSSGQKHPSKKWLDGFWKLVCSSLRCVPTQLQDIALVPTTDGRLASYRHCARNAALSYQHLKWMPSTAAATLTKVGCVCIEEPKAESASPLSRGADPLTHAIYTVTRQSGVSLSQLLSIQRLGKETFAEVRNLLANYTSDMDSSAWQILRESPIFEDYSGSMTNLAVGQLAFLPDEVWEQHLSALADILPWSPVKHHAASQTQQRLLRPSQMKPPKLMDFLQNSLLPAINRANNNTGQAEGLLLHALDDLYSTCPPRHVVSHLNSVFVNGCLHPISKCVDSTNELNKALFSQHGSNKNFLLLPAKYTSHQRISILKKQGLGHEGSASPDFFLSCGSQFSARNSSMSRDTSRQVSRYLVNMLCSHVSTFQKSSNWSTGQAAAAKIFTCPELPFPYSSSTSAAFVSLADSADHEHYRVVALAVPVTDNAHGDTKRLRAKLGLPTHPELQHVVKHLLKTAAAGHFNAAA